MSRLTERLARLEAEQAHRNDVLLAVYESTRPGGLPTLGFALGGDELARARAVAKWYASHPDVVPTEEHAKQIALVSTKRLREASLRGPARSEVAAPVKRKPRPRKP